MPLLPFLLFGIGVNCQMVRNFVDEEEKNLEALPETENDDAMAMEDALYLDGTVASSTSRMRLDTLYVSQRAVGEVRTLLVLMAVGSPMKEKSS